MYSTTVPLFPKAGKNPQEQEADSLTNRQRKRLKKKLRGFQSELSTQEPKAEQIGIETLETLPKPKQVQLGPAQYQLPDHGTPEFRDMLGESLRQAMVLPTSVDITLGIDVLAAMIEQQPKNRWHRELARFVPGVASWMASSAQKRPRPIL